MTQTAFSFPALEQFPLLSYLRQWPSDVETSLHTVGYPIYIIIVVGIKAHMFIVYCSLTFLKGVQSKGTK